MHRRLPLAVISTIDPVLRDSAVFGFVVDAPETVALRHDLLTDDEGYGRIRRLVVDVSGVIEDVTVPLEHACVSCAVREDAIPTLRRLARTGRWGAAVLALPVAADPFPVTRALERATVRGADLAAYRLAHTLAVVDVQTCEHDLLGDDLLDERALALAEDDRRAVGEALSAQLGHADVVVVTGDLAVNPVGSDLLEHLRASDSRRVDGLHCLDVHGVLHGRHDSAAAERRVDPRFARARLGPTDHGVWTITLHSERPLHPQRLLDRIEELGAGRLRARGVFWVPTRPDSVCAWDEAGGQLSIGEIDSWRDQEPRTHLVVTGLGDESSALRAVFADVLLTDAEARAGLARWLGEPDVLAPWLGERTAAS